MDWFYTPFTLQYICTSVHSKSSFRQCFPLQRFLHFFFFIVFYLINDLSPLLPPCRSVVFLYLFCNIKHESYAPKERWNQCRSRAEDFISISNLCILSVYIALTLPHYSSYNPLKHILTICFKLEACRPLHARPCKDYHIHVTKTFLKQFWRDTNMISCLIQHWQR